jgi:hypothetical protein
MLPIAWCPPLQGSDVGLDLAMMSMVESQNGSIARLWPLNAMKARSVVARTLAMKAARLERFWYLPTGPMCGFTDRKQRKLLQFLASYRDLRPAPA